MASASACTSCRAGSYATGLGAYCCATKVDGMIWLCGVSILVCIVFCGEWFMRMFAPRKLLSGRVSRDRVTSHACELAQTRGLVRRLWHMSTRVLCAGVVAGLVERCRGVDGFFQTSCEIGGSSSTRVSFENVKRHADRKFFSRWLDLLNVC